MSDQNEKLGDELAASGNKIAEHYNNKNKGDLHSRAQSRIFYMRNFNNWIKSVLINEFVKKLNRPNDLSVLDLGCGRGGDMRKWVKARGLKHVTFADLAEKSLEECRSRYDEMRPRFEARFIQLDATRDLLIEKLGSFSIID